MHSTGVDVMVMVRLMMAVELRLSGDNDTETFACRQKDDAVARARAERQVHCRVG